MDKFPILMGTAAVVFTGGVVLLVTPPVMRWVKAKVSAALDWFDGIVEGRFGATADTAGWDWEAASAAGGGLAFGCPECAGADRAEASRTELALLRANATSGRAELQLLRHKLALSADAITAADRWIAELSGQLVEASREVERLLRERAMRKPAGLKRASTRVASAPGVAMGDA